MTAKRSRLGFIGLGNMGSAICSNLVADGHEVWAFDRDDGRVNAMLELGAHGVGSAAETAGSTDITFLSLPTPAVMEVVAGEWIGAAKARDKILVDLTTNAPSTVQRVDELARENGARFVEAPVTGGAPGARNRQLVFIVGGDEDAVERVEPLLHSLGRAVVHLGPAGSGNIGKLVNSMLAFSATWTALECLTLAAKSGVDLRQVVELVRVTGAASSYLDRRVEQIAVRDRPAEFAIELAAKDAALMLELGRRHEVPLSIASALHDVLAFAQTQGFGHRDFSDLVEVAERIAGTSLHLRPPEQS